MNNFQEDNRRYINSEDNALPTINGNAPTNEMDIIEDMRGTMQALLAKNIGEFVVIEFLIGTERIMRKQGVLYEVGRTYVILYDEEFDNYIVCDIFSVKFIYFYQPGDRPRRNYNLLPPPINNISNR